MAWVSSAQASTSAWARARTLIVLTAGLLVVATGYFGGEMVWGRDWFQLSDKQAQE
jgi:hypothetical protein